jgi:(p)ppGpp synthase/HD superfamily hydrolase
MLILSPRFDQALQYASELHRRQARKGTTIPYIAHLMSVTALVLEDGGSEDEAIAALLHDAVEDQGGQATLAEIRRRFGEQVAGWVAELSDADTLPKPPWRERKEQYIAHLAQAGPVVLRISLADKLHNARSIRDDVRQEGEATWERFKGGQAGTLWYYRRLADFFQQRLASPRAAELERIVSELEALGGGSSTPPG